MSSSIGSRRHITFNWVCVLTTGSIKLAIIIYSRSKNASALRKSYNNLLVAKINQTVLMSDALHFGDTQAINPHMDSDVPINIKRAQAEHDLVAQHLESIGVQVIKVPSPPSCQDGVYTANWGLCRGNKVVLSSLPNARKSEEPYAKYTLQKLGKEVIEAPGRFSGQGDALSCGNLLFCGSVYRTDASVHQFLADTFGWEIVSLQTIPLLDQAGKSVNNVVSGWPDSFFYDLDLALSVLRDDLIAWCPDAFVPESQEKIRALSIDKIEVGLDEAKHGFACNLVSTGDDVIMSDQAPEFKQAIEAKGLRTITVGAPELAKGGGYIRCISLTLDN